MKNIKVRFFSGNRILLTFFLIASITGLAVSKDDIPQWLDTIPPKVSIEPAKKMHSSLFYIVLKANERSTIWYGINRKDKIEQFKNAIPVTNDGEYTIYYYGEDDFANKSKLDSIKYILDQKPPQITITPTAGIYTPGTVIHFNSDEQCQFTLLHAQSDSVGKVIKDSIVLKENIAGYIVAVDKCGNKTISEHVNFQIDTTRIILTVSPSEGIYKRPQKIRFSGMENGVVFFTFDPVQPQQWFTRYTKPVELPHGLTILRYYGKNRAGLITEIFQKRFIIDTVAPKIISYIGKGLKNDTVFLSTKEQSAIRYEIGISSPTKESNVYSAPVIVPHKGKFILRACAWDSAGNESDIYKWESKYDFEKPSLQISNGGGFFSKPQKIFITSNEPSKILYTLDDSKVTSNSLLYNSSEGILISREGGTTLRYMGIDEADNATDEKTYQYFIDSRPPQVKVRISGKLQDGSFQVQLLSDEVSTIYYEIDGTSGNTPLIYSSPLTLKTGQILSYFAIDRNGNKSPIVVMDELKRPRAEAVPDGGVYNKKLKISFVTNTDGQVLWRILPDTIFKPLNGNVVLDKEGIYSLEYFLKGENGLQSPTRRNEYTIDWTAPNVQINLKKGLKDSVVVFFQSSENATIYYTTDGTNPAISSTSRTAANKYFQSTDRIIIPRSKDTRLAFIAEDVAKNQSAISILDVMSPRAIPNVPSGKEKIYDRILSITLNTIDQSTIYYSRHGNVPSTDSAIYSEPITLMESDTIVAFVVDASGYKGQPDTFIYLIDLPPSPQVFISDSAISGKPVGFDATGSIDRETPFDQLLFRWDFDGDGKFDTDKGKYPKVNYTYSKSGNYSAVLEVTDKADRTAKILQLVNVRGICPSDMVSISDETGYHFCMDVYEWPNVPNKIPQTNVSWVEAKMTCIDAGKRLCTAKEWETACHGVNRSVYPYGNAFQSRKCPTEGTSLFKSGNFKSCSDKVNDMVGNAWEWVEDKNGDYPLLYGGSYEYGKNAHCGLRAEGNIASRSGEIGFRCCK